MNVDQFDFELPAELIAQSPLVDRASSRLLMMNRMTGRIEHGQFRDITQHLEAGDTLVLNDTRVIPARLFGIKQDTGAKVELLLLKSIGGNRWEALVRPGKKLHTGAVIEFGSQMDHGKPALIAIIESEGEMGARIIRFEYEGIFAEILDRLGHMPLPPYIKEQLQEKERYQTVYAKHRGSSAAPTAGLHFTELLLQEISDKGVHVAYVTLHVGLGTFRPVSVERVEEHRMHEEYYQMNQATANLLNETRRSGGKVVAVGTTSCRTLESIANKCEDEFQACEGWTDIFIYPGYTFQIVDALLTNFHLPKSTLVMLVSAFAGTDYVQQAYQEAIDQRYRFFSFGDAMLLY
ncbi:MAG: tRNA preQ1(34) S-adenosylmethionine ribosyltransferase-isomerase QueA [Paenibacillaceae bacterium]